MRSSDKKEEVNLTGVVVEKLGEFERDAPTSIATGQSKTKLSTAVWNR